MGKFFWGSVANKNLGKVTEAFRNIPSSFGAVVRKPGLGVYPPPTCNARVKFDFSYGSAPEPAGLAYNAHQTA